MSMYAVVNPATGETVKEYPEITDEQLDAAIGRAAAAYEAWAAAPDIGARGELVRAVAQPPRGRQEGVAEIIRPGRGKADRQAMGEVAFSASIYEYYAQRSEALLADEP